MNQFRLGLVLGASLLVVNCKTLDSKTQLIHTSEERVDKATAQAVGTQYAISTHGKFASLAAQKMFDLGGNIIDASIAASFVISVERPQSTGLGGGGFMVYHDAKTKKSYAIDFRERAPLAAHESMYLDNKGNPIPELSRNGILAAGVPGLVAGLLEIHQKFGKLKLSQVIEPAIELAEKGFEVYPDLHKALEVRQPTLVNDPEAKRIFLSADGKVPDAGSLLVQKDLAKTLKTISQKGHSGFYKGEVAKSIVTFSKRSKGLITQKDLDTYKVFWREPLIAEVSDFKVVTMPPPSSGGIHVLQFLKMLHNDPLLAGGPLTKDSIHLAAATLQLAFADRAQFLGDPDFVKVPTQGLLSSEYLKKRRLEISPNKARKADQVSAGNPLPYESSDTTHFSIIDAEGNAVASTQTINGWMGAGVVVPNTGILLNNEMDDFSAKVADQNLFGAIGGSQNKIEPRKTPLSSMSPTILLRDDKPFMSVGAPGGTRIISCVAQTILNYTEFKMSLYDSVAAIRYHHQWKPDVLIIDPPGPQPKVKSGLEKMGYDIKIQPTGCKVMAVAKEADKLLGATDPRDIGIAVAK